jgi:hypothetical protein
MELPVDWIVYFILDIEAVKKVLKIHPYFTLCAFVHSLVYFVVEYLTTKEHQVRLKEHKGISEHPHFTLCSYI